MASSTEYAQRARPVRANRLTALQFVMAFGVVSLLADFVYEGARAIAGPYLATFGASAVLVGFVTGAGEAVALVLRLATGRLSDRTQRYWALSIAGYAVTVVSVPLLSAAATLWQASGLIVAERFGKAVRTPARDSMLAHAASRQGRGRVFALHEVLDRSGALIGPLVVAAIIALRGYRASLLALAVPGLAALCVLAWLRRAVPQPQSYETQDSAAGAPPGAAAADAPLSREFWLYSAFTAASMLGFATFGVIAYHLDVQHVLPVSLIPVAYAAAMGAGGLAALGSGLLYDRIGLRSLGIVLPLTAVVPLLAFSSRPLLAWVGAVAWGIVTGVHGSTMRAAVADLSPARRRGSAYGTFGAVYGLAWLVGATLIGALYAHSIRAAVLFSFATQLLALVPLAQLLRLGRARPPSSIGGPAP